MKHLGDISIRYEVVYKNLLRDMRRYFALDLSNNTGFSKLKLEQKGLTYFTECLAQYISERFNIQGQEHFNSLIVTLGALTYPREMICFLGGNQYDHS